MNNTLGGAGADRSRLLDGRFGSVQTDRAARPVLRSDLAPTESEHDSCSLSCSYYWFKRKVTDVTGSIAHALTNNCVTEWWGDLNPERKTYLKLALAAFAVALVLFLAAPFVEGAVALSFLVKFGSSIATSISAFAFLIFFTKQNS